MTRSVRFLAIPSILFAFAGLSANPALAAWPHDPTANLRLSAGSASPFDFPAIVSDGAGGAIVVWTDTRLGDAQILAQRVSAAGVPLWGTFVPVTLVFGSSRQAPVAAADGAGGVLIAWQDYRNSSLSQIYVQRLNSSGSAMWTGNGVRLLSGLEDQFPDIVPDGAGGALIAYERTYSALDHDPMVAHVSSGGAADFGTDLCTLVSLQTSPRICSDGFGGAIVTWQDQRGGNWDIYAARFTSGGSSPWTSQGALVSGAAGDQIAPRIVDDGAGGAIVAWTDSRAGNNDVYAGKLTPSGSSGWGANLPIATTANAEAIENLGSDGSGGALVFIRSFAATLNEEHAQRITGSGLTPWAAAASGGVTLASGPGDNSGAVSCPDGSGGAVVAWVVQTSSQYDVSADRITGSGTLAAGWASNGTPVATAAGDQHDAAIASDGAGGAIVAWVDNRTANTKDIYVQRIERFGQLGNPEPSIAGIRDVPNDQGGHVKVSWNASYLDNDPQFGISSYWIWRSVPPNAAAAALRTRGSRLIAEGDPPPRPGERGFKIASVQGASDAWEYVASQAAQAFASYSYVAPTAEDSIGASNPYTAFMIEAKPQSPYAYWNSAPDSGYSVDNLPPVAPSAFSATFSPPNGTFVTWGANGESDLAGYRLHRGGGLGFTPSPENRIYEGSTPSYHDVTSTAYIYKVCAYDIHGNEGGCSTAQPPGTAAVGDGVPKVLSLAPIDPNPAAGGANLRFGLPRDGRVTVAIYDAQGRRVRTVIDAWLPAGVGLTRWDGRDAAGEAAGSGLYFATLEAGGRRLTQRFISLR